MKTIFSAGRMLVVILIVCWLGVSGYSQNDSLPVVEPEVSKLAVSGYVKNLQTWLFLNAGGQTTFLQDNLLHHRLNVRWDASPQLTVYAEMRNRAFFGDLVKVNPQYGDQVAYANDDYFRLSAVVLNSQSWVVHTMLDRFYAEWQQNDWEVSLGRQRINWGISTVWNPNDWFNAFNFTDFDYEERPGSDAIRIRRYTGYAGSIELAAKAFDTWNEAVVAGLWRFNRWNYDFQLLAGYVRQDWALGAGWAGNLGNAGWKGEFSAFFPQQGVERDPALAMTWGVDYSFSNALYAQVGYLYNSAGQLRGDASGLFAFELSARNLYPYRHAVFLQASYPVSPLVQGGLALIYSPVEAQALFLNPTLGLSVANNWGLDLVGQLIFDQEPEGYRSPIQAAFVRLKYSY
ncbi:MAG: hypothetical protein H6555_02930 [Lewinellaceae bacterium]|nr:hypothetical protein [Lewinellaceae bacterium]